MFYRYHATLQDDPDGGIIVTFDDVPEAITAGETREEALSNAREALALALRGILQAGRRLPQPVSTAGAPVALDADIAAKLALIQAFRESGLTKSELARRLRKSENEARRLLDPDHPSKIGVLQQALRVLGLEIAVTVGRAA
jgi:antitoxin HicB